MTISHRAWPSDWFQKCQFGAILELFSCGAVLLRYYEYR